MRRYLSFCLISLVALIIWWAYPQISKIIEKDVPPSSSTIERPLAPKKPQPRPPQPTPFPETITLLPIASSTDQLHSLDTTPEDDLSLIHTLLRSHRSALGTNPIGLNDEITAALTGKNTKGAACLPQNHPAISQKGELLDRWKTPYRFHAYSGKLMEIHSAGPDKKFFTQDDLKLVE